MDLKLIFEFVVAMVLCDIVRGFLVGIAKAITEGIEEGVKEVKKEQHVKLKERTVICGFVDRKDET